MGDEESNTYSHSYFFNITDTVIVIILL